MPNNKYLNVHLEDKARVKMWYKFLLDYNGKYNIAAKHASLELVAGWFFKHKYMGGIIEFIDDINLAWAQMGHLNPSEHLDDEQKICKLINKITCTGCEIQATQAEIQPDGKTWEGFIHNFKSLLQHTIHGIVTHNHLQKAHKPMSSCQYASASNPSDDEFLLILSVCSKPSQDNWYTFNSHQNNLSIPQGHGNHL